MSRAEYYHRQADLCVRMALSALKDEERNRLLDVANEYRQKAAMAETQEPNSRVARQGS
jgi:adenine C2-methylase RlmN of 23S rRNA A2503 and tRNA A37